MPAVARIGLDRIITGHLCSRTARIAGPGATGPLGTVYVQGSIAACAGDAISPHTIRSGKSCIGHAAIVNPRPSASVIAAGRPIARIGDSADSGFIITGAFRVFAGI